MLLYVVPNNKSWRKIDNSKVLQSKPKKTDLLMQPSMGTSNSPSSRVVKDSTPSRRRISRCINFGIGESSPNLFLNLVRFEAQWILNELAFYCFISFFIWKWILT